VSVVVAGPAGRTAAARGYVASLAALAGPAAEDGRFQVVGEVPHEQLEDLYRACDLVVIPSVWAEPAPMVAIEAMAHGKPVVATRTGGLPAMVPDGEAGLLVPPGDAPALAGAIRRLVDDPTLRASLGQGARARARDRYSLRGFGIEHARLYSSL